MYAERRKKKASREGEPAPIHLLAGSRQVQRYGSLTRSIFYFGLCALIKLQAKCPRRAHNPALALTHNSASQTFCSASPRCLVRRVAADFRHVSGDVGGGCGVWWWLRDRGAAQLGLNRR